MPPTIFQMDVFIKPCCSAPSSLLGDPQGLWGLQVGAESTGEGFSSAKWDGGGKASPMQERIILEMRNINLGQMLGLIYLFFISAW